MSLHKSLSWGENLWKNMVICEFLALIDNTFKGSMSCKYTQQAPFYVHLAMIYMILAICEFLALIDNTFKGRYVS